MDNNYNTEITKDTNQQLQNKPQQQQQMLEKQKENQENAEVQSENNKVQSLQQIFQRLKLKIVSKKMVNNTNTRMLKNLTNLQYYLINDKSMYLDQKKVLLDTQKAKNKALSNFQLQEDIQIEDPWYYQIYFMLKRLTLFRQLAKIRQMIPIISPSSTFKLTWDFVHMISILVYMFLIPINISFGLPFYYLLSYQLHHITPYSLIFDMFVNMITSYYDKGILVTSGFKIIQNYIIQHGVTDMLSIMPFLYNYWTQEQVQDENLLDMTDGEQFANRPIDYSIEKFFMLFFFMKIFSFQHIFKKIEERSHLSRKMTNVISLIKLLFTIITIAHILACTWIFMGRMENQANIQNTWQDNVGITEKRWYIQYIYAYYFSTVTMVTVGYGDILPKTPQEMVLSTIAIMFSCGVFAYSVNEVGSIFHDLSRTEREINESMQVINFYMDKKKVKRNLQYQIREYLNYYWKEVSERDKDSEDKIIGQLSDTLKEELLIEANKIVLKDSPIFKNNFTDKIIYKTVPLIKETRSTPEQVIMREGELDDCQIFFIEKGTVEIYIDIIIPGQLQEQPFVLQKLKEGDCFGVESFFTGQARNINARSTQFTTLLMINRSDFLQLLKGFPDDYEQFCAIKDNISHYNNFDQVGLNCYCCNSSKHQLYQCPFLHYQANKQKIIKQYNKKQIATREYFDRKRYKDKKQRTLKELLDNQQYTQLYQEENEESILFQISVNGYDQDDDNQDEQIEQINDIASDNNQSLLNNEDIQDNILQFDNQEFAQNNQNNESFNQQQTQQQRSIEKYVSQDSQQQQQTPQKPYSPSYSYKSVNSAALSPSFINLQNQLKQSDQHNNQLKQYCFNSKQSTKQDMQIIQTIRDKKRKSSISSLSSKFDQKKVHKMKDFINILKLMKNKKVVQKNSNHNDDISSKLLLQLLQNQQLSNKQQPLIKNDDSNHDQEEQFDVFKDYHFYFPYNNLSYQVELLQLEPEERKFRTERIHLDNKLAIKKSQNKIKGQRKLANVNILKQNQFESEQKMGRQNQCKQSVLIDKNNKIHSEFQKKKSQGSLLITKNKSLKDKRQSSVQDASKLAIITLEQIKEEEENKEELKEQYFNKNESGNITANQSLLKSFITNNNNYEDQQSQKKINNQQKSITNQSINIEQLQKDEDFALGSERKPNNITPFVVGLFGSHINSNSDRSARENTNKIIQNSKQDQILKIELYSEKNIINNNSD